MSDEESATKFRQGWERLKATVNEVMTCVETFGRANDRSEAEEWLERLTSALTSMASAGTEAVRAAKERIKVVEERSHAE